MAQQTNRSASLIDLVISQQASDFATSNLGGSNARKGGNSPTKRSTWTKHDKALHP
jgi:hypothetical protein